MRCHMRHEYRRMPQLPGYFALVDMLGECIRHQVVAQQFHIVLVMGVVPAPE